MSSELLTKMMQYLKYWPSSSASFSLGAVSSIAPQPLCLQAICPGSLRARADSGTVTQPSCLTASSASTKNECQPG